MFCSQCGTALGADDRLCPRCGAPVPSIHESVPMGPIPSASAFRDPSRLTQWLKFFLFASIVIDVIALFSGILQYQLLSDFRIGAYGSQELATAAAESNDNRQMVIALSQFTVAIATIVLFARWIYRANFNVRQLGAQGLHFTPGWSIGYYFIPILMLWKPYQAMKEIWQASKNPASWTSVERGAILPWWWFFFLVSGMLGQTSLRLSLRAKEIDELISSTGIAIASDLVSIPSAIVALILIKQIYAMQMSHVPRAVPAPADG